MRNALAFSSTLLALMACAESSQPLVSPYSEMKLPTAGGRVVESLPQRTSIDHKGVDVAKKRAEYMAAITTWGCKEDAPPKVDATWIHWSCMGNGRKVDVQFDTSPQHPDRVTVMIEAKPVGE